MNTVTYESMIEEIALSWAIIDGKGNLYVECKNDPEKDEELGYYEGYLSDARALIGNCPTVSNAMIRLEMSN